MSVNRGRSDNNKERNRKMGVEQLATISCQRLFLVAVISRCCVAAYMITCAAVSDPYDGSERYYPQLMLRNLQQSSNGAEAQLCSSSLNDLHSSPAETLFRALNHWDSVHYWSIASSGYQTISQRAFFPLYPILVLRSIRGVSAWLLRDIMFVWEQPTRTSPCISSGGAPAFLLLCYVMAFVVNIVCFSLAAVALRRVTRQMLRVKPFRQIFVDPEGSESVALSRFTGCVVLLFLLSPASVFTVASYTESLFSVFSMVAAGLFVSNDWWAGTCVAALGALCRSNGVLLACPALFSIFALLRDSTRNPRRSQVCQLLSRVIQFFIILAPYAAVNYFGCVAHRGGEEDRCSGLDFLGFYASVQEEFWNVGWFRYYTLRKAPNFLVALPLPFFVVLSIAHSRPTTATTERGVSCVSPRSSTFVSRVLNRFPFSAASSILRHVITVLFSDPWTFVLLTTIALCSVMLHVETINRLLLPNPALYWWTAQVLSRDDGRSRSFGGLWLHRARWALFAFHFSWTAIGGALFANHLPWT